MIRLLIVALLASATGAVAAPSVFVRGEPGVSWWSGQIEARILGRAAGPITVQQLSAYIRETMLFSPYEICSLEAVLEISRIS